MQESIAVPRWYRVALQGAGTATTERMLLKWLRWRVAGQSAFGAPVLASLFWRPPPTQNSELRNELPCLKETHQYA
jgi:hypothetical protein